MRECTQPYNKKDLSQNPGFAILYQRVHKTNQQKQNTNSVHFLQYSVASNSVYCEGGARLPFFSSADLDACRRGISPVSHKYLTCISPVSHQYLSSISPVSHQYLSSISPVSQQYLTSISPVSQQHLTSISPVSHQYLTSISAVSHQYLTMENCVHIM